MKLNIKYRLTAPLSHIGETASTGSYFQTVLTSSGRLPVVTANSVRGQLRNCGAKHLLDTWNVKVDKEVFHTLFSGGNLSGVMKNDIEKALKVREIFPLISVLGGGLGDIIMAGKMNITFAYPICKESQQITDVESDVSWHKLIEEMEFTRTDDSKNDKFGRYIENLDAEKESKASTQMRYSVQYIAPGTEFVQVINLANANDVEKGALLTALCEWFKNPVMGGMAAKGFGFFDSDVSDGLISVKNGKISVSQEAEALINTYENFLTECNFKPYLSLLKGAVKNGKKSDKSTEGDSEVD